MTNEELILEKLDRLEAQIAPFIKIANGIMELKNDLVPLQNQAVHLLINELKDVEAGFELEDLLILAKQTMRSVKSLTFSLRQMENIIEFVNDLEPLMKSAVPQLIAYLDELEHRGILRIMKAMLDVRAKVAASYTAEDIEQISDVMVRLLGLVKKFQNPDTLAFLEKAAELPGKINLADCKKVSPFGLISAGFDEELQEGIGVMLELTKAMGKMKHNGQKGP